MVIDNHIERRYISKKEFNEEFKLCYDNGKIWSNKLALMIDQLIDNHLSSNKFRFNRGYNIAVYHRVKERIMDKLLTQLMNKFNYEKSSDPFSFTGSFIRNWGMKYIFQEAKWGYNPDVKKYEYDRYARRYLEVIFVSAF